MESRSLFFLSNGNTERRHEQPATRGHGTKRDACALSALWFEAQNSVLVRVVDGKLCKLSLQEFCLTEDS